MTEALKQAQERLEQLTYVLRIDPPLTHDGEMLVQPAIAYAEGALVPLLTKEQIDAILPILDAWAQEARLDAHAKTIEGLEEHIKDWPNLGDCEWNCTTAGPLLELVRKARLEEAKWWMNLYPGFIKQHAGYHLAWGGAKGFKCEACDRIAALEQRTGEPPR